MARSIAGMLCGAVVLCAPSAMAGSFTYQVLPYGAEPAAINDNGQVVGKAMFNGQTYQAFVWYHGAFTQPANPSHGSSSLCAIASSGIAAGSIDAAGKYAWLIHDPDTDISRSVKFPYSGCSINARGDIVGLSDTEGYGGELQGHTVLTIAVTGAEETIPDAINNAGTVTGTWFDGGAVHGFFYQNGSYTSFDSPDPYATYPTFITNNGTIGGWFESPNLTGHGFTMRDGAMTTYDVPGANTDSDATSVIGIGAAGAVFGNWVDSNAITHGFVYAGGAYYSLDFPAGANVTGTWITGVNSRDTIIGEYQVNWGEPQGFVATCAKGQSPCTSFAGQLPRRAGPGAPPGR